MKVEKYAFNKIKRIVARDNLLTYPDLNEMFKIFTDANTYQLGEVIIQKVKLIAFYGRGLINTQQRYKVTEKEIIITVETLKEFRTILLGQKIRIYTDHKNLHVMILIPTEY